MALEKCKPHQLPIKGNNEWGSHPFPGDLPSPGGQWAGNSILLSRGVAVFEEAKKKRNEMFVFLSAQQF